MTHSPTDMDKPKLNDLNVLDDPDMEPDWNSACYVCGNSPVVPLTGMCGPCTFDEADTIDGNW